MLTHRSNYLYHHFLFPLHFVISPKPQLQGFIRKPYLPPKRYQSFNGSSDPPHLLLLSPTIRSISPFPNRNNPFFLTLHCRFVAEAFGKMKPIFCGNLDFDARQSDVERLFRKYGKIDRVDLKSGITFFIISYFFGYNFEFVLSFRFKVIFFVA